jgi:hypothetical protein
VSSGSAVLAGGAQVSAALLVSQHLGFYHILTSCSRYLRALLAALLANQVVALVHVTRRSLPLSFRTSSLRSNPPRRLEFGRGQRRASM